MKPTERTLRAWTGQWVDSRFQLRFAMFMALSSAALMVGLGWMVLEKTRAVTAVSIHTLETHRETLDDTSADIERLRVREQRLMRLLVDVGLLFAVGLFFYGLRMTHRVVDPLERIGRHLELMREGRFEVVEQLPEGDQLVDLYERFRSAQGFLRSTQAHDVQRMRAVLEEVERARLPGLSPRLVPLMQAMRARIRHKEKGLG